MFVFDAEKWIYERKQLYPLVDCIKSQSSTGIWENFNFHPVINNVTLQPDDIVIATDETRSEIIHNLKTIINNIPQGGSCTHIALLRDGTPYYYNLNNRTVYQFYSRTWDDSGYCKETELLKDYIFVYNVDNSSYKFSGV